MNEHCGGPSQLILPKDMDHNEFDFYEDLTVPFSSFLQRCGISVHPENLDKAYLRIPGENFNVPDKLPRKIKAGRWNGIFKMFNS